METRLGSKDRPIQLEDDAADAPPKITNFFSPQQAAEPVVDLSLDDEGASPAGGGGKGRGGGGLTPEQRERMERNRKRALERRAVLQAAREAEGERKRAAVEASSAAVVSAHSSPLLETVGRAVGAGCFGAHDANGPPPSQRQHWSSPPRNPYARPLANPHSSGGVAAMKAISTPSSIGCAPFCSGDGASSLGMMEADAQNVEVDENNDALVDPSLPPCPREINGVPLSEEQIAILKLARPPTSSSVLPEGATGGETDSSTGRCGDTTTAAPNNPGRLVRVTAAAGTGKTTTLLALAVRCVDLGHDRISYVAFSRAAAADGRRRMLSALADERRRREEEECHRPPAAVDASTLHSCAMKLLRVADGEEDQTLEGNGGQLLDVDDVQDVIRKLCGRDVEEFLTLAFAQIAEMCRGRLRWIAERDRRNMEDRARQQVIFFIYKTLTQFCQSDMAEADFAQGDGSMKRDYYPARRFHQSGGDGEKAGFPSQHYVKQSVLRFYADRAAAVWAHMAENRMKSYDIEMKRAQLRGLRVPCTALLVDECQDMDACQVSWMAAQKKFGTHIFFVGDAAQTIFSFRGAKPKHVMRLGGAVDRSLTKSWRFGPAIARLANVVLFAKHKSPQTVEGPGCAWRPYRVVGAGGSDGIATVGSLLSWWKERQVTLIARGNITLMMRVLGLLGMTYDETRDGDTATNDEGDSNGVESETVAKEDDGSQRMAAVPKSSSSGVQVNAEDEERETGLPRPTVSDAAKISLTQTEAHGGKFTLSSHLSAPESDKDEVTKVSLSEGDIIRDESFSGQSHPSNNPSDCSSTNLVEEEQEIKFLSVPKIHINGKGENSGVQKWKSALMQIEHLYDLFISGTDGSVLPAKRFKEFRGKRLTWKEFTKTVENRELTRYIHSMGVIEKFGKQTPRAMEIFQEQVLDKNYSSEEADIVLSTCHSAKGMEWDHVELCDDFFDIADYIDNGPSVPDIPLLANSSNDASMQGKKKTRASWQFNAKSWGDDLNLLYVACTRARETLSVPDRLKQVLNDFDLFHDHVQAWQNGKAENETDGAESVIQMDSKKRLTKKCVCRLYQDLCLPLRKEVGLNDKDMLLESMLK